jgi:hypothetical protein
MISKLLLSLQLGLIAIGASPKKAPAAPDPVARVKAAKTPESLRQALLDLGVPAKVLDSLQADKSMPAPGWLKRAETFKANLDADPARESVTQVFFEANGDSNPDGKARIYFVLVHKGKAEGAPAAFHFFDLLYCNHADAGGMTFAFKGGARKDIVFKQRIFESCGMQVSSYDQADTLRFQNGAYSYIEGAKSGESSMDRGEIPEP